MKSNKYYMSVLNVINMEFQTEIGPQQKCNCRELVILKNLVFRVEEVRDEVLWESIYCDWIIFTIFFFQRRVKAVFKSNLDDIPHTEVTPRILK